MATLKFTKNASRIVLKSVLESKPPTEELSSLKDEVKFLKDILHIKRFGGGISELIYKVKELQSENDKLKKLSIAPKPQVLQLINQNLVLQRELTKYRNQSPPDDLEPAGLDTTENQSLLKEQATKTGPASTYIISSFKGDSRPTNSNHESLGNRNKGGGESQFPVLNGSRITEEGPSERKKDYRIATLEPSSPRKSHPALFSPREVSEGLNERATAKKLRGSGLDLDEPPKMKFALGNIKLKSPVFSAKSGLQSGTGQGEFSASEKNPKGEKYPALNASASKNYLKTHHWEAGGTVASSMFASGKPGSVKRNDSQDALFLVEDLIQKRMIKQFPGGQQSLKHSKFSESPRAENHFAGPYAASRTLTREARHTPSNSPQAQDQGPPLKADLQLRQSVRTSDLLRRLQEISALSFEPPQPVSPQQSRFGGPAKKGHLFNLNSNRPPTPSLTKPKLRSSEPNGAFLGKVEFNMKEMKRELERLKFT
jgi:hypothetical protein